VIVLHPNTGQYNALNGYRHKSSKLLFVKDGSDRWIVGLEILSDHNFAEIHDQLDAPERIEYTPMADIVDE
jgi:hypothetical protein